MYSGPHIKRDGLVFGYDTGRNPSSNFDHKNKKRRFFKGRAVTNVVTNTNLNTGWSKGYQTAIEYDEIKPPPGVKSQVVGFNKSSSSSYWYSYGDYAPQTPNTTYTVSIYVKTRDSNFRIRFYTANNSETGRVWGSYITVPNDNKWHRIVWPSFLNPSNSQSDSLSFNFSMADTGDSSRTWFCAPQMEVGTIASPFVDGTRSTTNSLIDLTKSTTIDVSNVSFDSDGLPTFDGTDDSIVLTDPGVSSSTGFSIELVIKPGNASSSPMVITPLSGGIDHYIRFNGNGTLYLRMIPAADSSAQDFVTSSTLSSSNYHHVIFTFKQSEGGKAFYNGSLENSASANFTALDWTSTWRVGQRGNNTFFYQGELPVLKIYNRALTAQEVKQNFRAYKNRFDI
mgnify:CR=1 FL=1